MKDDERVVRGSVVHRWREPAANDQGSAAGRQGGPSAPPAPGSVESDARGRRLTLLPERSDSDAEQSRREDGLLDWIADELIRHFREKIQR